jgi:hypothetical protein
MFLESGQSCRVCLNIEPADQLISPCQCEGSLKYIHHQCLNNWRLRTININYIYCCEICHSRYKSPIVIDRQYLKLTICYILPIFLLFGIIIINSYIIKFGIYFLNIIYRFKKYIFGILIFYVFIKFFPNLILRLYLRL